MGWCLFVGADRCKLAWGQRFFHQIFVKSQTFGDLTMTLDTQLDRDDLYHRHVGTCSWPFLRLYHVQRMRLRHFDQLTLQAVRDMQGRNPVLWPCHTTYLGHSGLEFDNVLSKQKLSETRRSIDRIRRIRRIRTLYTAVWMVDLRGIRFPNLGDSNPKARFLFESMQVQLHPCFFFRFQMVA